MAGKKLRLQVITPARTVLDKEVDFVLLRTVSGDMGVLHGHEPAAVLLNSGLLRAFVNKQETDALTVLGGFANIRGDRVVVMSTLAEAPDKVQAILAQRERERAENQLREQSADLEIRRAERALRQTLVQMEVSPFTLIKGEEEIEE